MNIFLLDWDVTKCAEQHVDKHCVKMMTELAQVLSTAHRILDGTESTRLSKMGRRTKCWALPEYDSVIYSATHVNHPSTVWARTSKENYEWLYSLFTALCKEYTYRYGKVYKAFRDDGNGLGELLSRTPKNIPSRGMTSFALAMPDEYKCSDPVLSYRKYYKFGKQHLHSWTKRPTPDWITNEHLLT
jgi:hypothetical protein